MKVLLVSANTTHAPHPVYPLGLDYLIGALTPRHEVQILDVNMIGGGEQIEAALRDANPEVIGLSIRNIDNVDTLAVKSFVPGYERMVRLIRRCTGAPIVLGGSGFSIFPGELMSLLGADFGVVGEGEYMVSLLEALERGGDPSVPCPLDGRRQAADAAGGRLAPILPGTGGNPEPADEKGMPLPLPLLHLSPYRGAPDAAGPSR
jgi:radical SAM superfamily enzyme YgiQ (UPF0313 family)